MLELCDKLFDFYPIEIDKVTKRIKHFKKVRESWEKKEED